MKNTKILTSAAFFALAAIALLAGCGDLDSPDGKTCKTAQDCTSSAGTKYHCVDYDGTQGTCRLACDKADGSGGDQDSCNKATEECKDYSPTTKDGTIDPNSPKVFACAPKTSTTPGDQDECTSDAQCADKGERNVCDLTTKKCIKPSEIKPKFFSVVVVDTTTDQAACNAADAGVDITGISISPTDGTTAWAKFVHSAPGTPAPRDGHFNATFPTAGYTPSPMAGKDQCLLDSLKDNPNKYTSLGCQTGFLSVNFDQGYEKGTVQVYEYLASVCGKNGTAGGTGDKDKYDVYICQKKEIINLDETKDPASKCEKIGTDQNGYSSLPFGS